MATVRRRPTSDPSRARAPARAPHDHPAISDGAAVAGAGAKLANIFSSEFVVETADSSSGKRFKQTFRDNMLTRGEPQIKPCNQDWTRITFVPDFAKFHMEARGALAKPSPPTSPQGVDEHVYTLL